MKTKNEKKESTFKILSIDGGGIRGIIPAAVLMEVEGTIRKHKRDDTLKIGECFDLIAGASTGGILTCMFLIPDKDRPDRARFSASDALGLYMEHGKDIFDRSIWQMIVSSGGLTDEKYSAEILETILSFYFKDHRLSELIRPCLITAYDTEKYHYHLKMVFASIGKGNQYLRIDGTFEDSDIEGIDPAMDNAAPENMKLLERFGRRLAAHHTDAIRKFVETYF
ncbi:MAG: patatin-like phospholipase family protein [Desulfobacterales bacterium]|nr:patatin-like phospholipase family protein [Desulfobacterales bacterium]